MALAQEASVSERTERALLAAILGLFVLLGATYSVVVLPFEASDEKWHYPMVKYTADNWSLPVQVPEAETPGVEATPWRQEGSQAPLYYALAAAATFWIDTSDMEVVRHLNPHADAGATPDGNVNLVVHDPALERFPWCGTVLAIHVVRFLSVLMGAAAVYLTYRIAREVLPGQPALALGAAAVHAFTPMYIFISASVNNDNLAVPLSSLALLMLIKIASLESQHTSSKSLAISYLPLGFVLGLAALTKSQALALAALTALVIAVRAVRRRSWRELLVGGLATALPLLLIASWWYLRNLRLYGDLTGLGVFKEILGTRDVPADLPQLWRERFSFLAGYWGNFGGLNVAMAAWAYSALNAVVVVAALGLVVILLKPQISDLKPKGLILRPWSFVLCLLWALGVFIPWLWWARDTWSSQGRLVFYAISVWSLLLVLGLAGWFPRRWGEWAVAAFVLFLLGLAAVAPFIWIVPAYALPQPLTEAQIATISHPLGVDFAETMRLLGYDLETGTVEPGEQVGVTLYWEALSPANRNYTVFVHLLGEGELLVAQRDTFPGLGLLSTTWLEPGNTWADRYVLRLPDTAYTPDVAQIEVGLYDAATGARLAASSGGDNVRFGRVQIRARSGDVPNPISVNFGDQMELVGYDLDRRVARPGDEVTLTLYWRGLRRMETNHTVSTQLVDAAQVKAAQHDGWPVDGAAPTAAWEPGAVITDVRALTIYPDAPPGAYDLQVVVYVQEEGKIVRLPVIPTSGDMLASHVLLTKVRVAP
jgi:hypothetical protein